MKTLLWKEYRQNRRVLAGVGMLLAAPYAIAAVVGAVLWVKQAPPIPDWTEVVAVPTVCSLALSALMAGFIAASVMASERADRSAEFAAYLPIPRNRALASKCVLAVGTWGATWVVFMAIYGLLRWVVNAGDYAGVGEMGVGVLATGICIIGVVWVVAARWGSPPIAAALGLAAPVLVASGLALVASLREQERVGGDRWAFIAYLVIGLVLGVGGFVGGSAYFLRRERGD